MKYRAIRNEIPFASRGLKQIGRKVLGKELAVGPTIGGGALKEGVWKTAFRTGASSTLVVSMIVGGTILLISSLMSSIREGFEGKWFSVFRENILPITIILVAVMFLIMSGRRK